MGCGASVEGSGKGGQVHKEPKDPDDLELDPVEMKETLIPSFDTFFTNASAPLNSLVDMNNEVNSAVNEVKTAVAKILNAYYVEVNVGKDTDVVHVDVLTKGGTPVQPQDVVEILKNPAPELQKADVDLSVAAKKLKDALENASGEHPLVVSDAGDVSTSSADAKVKEAVDNFKKSLSDFKTHVGKAGGLTVKPRVIKADPGADRIVKTSLVKDKDPNAEDTETIPVTLLDVLKAKGSAGIFEAAARVEKHAKTFAGELKNEHLKQETVTVETRKLVVPKYDVKEMSTKKNYLSSLVNCNSALFKLSKVCMVVNGDVGIAQAVKEVVKSIKDEAIKTAKQTAADSVKESFQIKPVLDVKDDGSFDFNIEYSLDPTIAPAPFSPDLLPKKARLAWEAILSVKQAVITVVEGVPAIKEQIETLTDEAKELTSKAKDEALSAGLGFGEALSATKNTAANLKTLGAAPNIVNSVLDCCKLVVDEFKKAVEVAAA